MAIKEGGTTSQPSSALRSLDWVNNAAYREFTELPEDIQRTFGWALLYVQHGETPVIAKPWKGLGSGVYELRESDEDGTYRCVYLAKYEEVVYVLHAFQKKSTRGIKTPEQTINLIEQRFKAAEADHKARYAKESD